MSESKLSTEDKLHLVGVVVRGIQWVRLVWDSSPHEAELMTKVGLKIFETAEAVIESLPKR